MAKREIEDEEYNFLQQRRSVADFVESIYNDPTLNREAKALIKRKYPQLNIPDYDLEEKVTARLDKEKTDREEAESKKRQKEEDDRISNMRKKTKDEYGFTDDAMKRLEDMMVERNIGDYEVAASYMASKTPKTSEPTFDSQHWHHERAPGFAEIAKDPEAWGRNEIMQAINKDEQRQKGGR
jgi:hypothetical protein